MANFSRLLIDPNRGIDDPTLIPKLSEGKIIKGNVNISISINDKERVKRIHQFYLPYHNQINRFINKSLDNGQEYLKYYLYIALLRYGRERKEKLMLVFYGIKMIGCLKFS